MQRKFRILFCFSCSDNRKSKIKNRKLVGIIALIIAFTMCGAVATAQQPTKIARIGYLGGVSLSANTARHDAFRQGSGRASLRGG